MPLLVFLPPRDDAPIHVFDTGMQRWSEAATLDQAAETISDEPVWAVLPGDCAITRQMALAMKGQRDVVRAAGFLLDDVAAIGGDGLTVGYGPVEDGQRLVTAMAKDVVMDALAQLQEAGIDPDLLTTDHALLKAPEEGEVLVLAVGETEWTRLADAAFTAETGFAESLLAQDDDHIVKRLTAGDLAAYLNLSPPNFRVGPLIKRQPLPDLRPYLLAASVLLFAGVLFLISSYIEGMRYRGAADDLRRTAEQQYLEAFPGSPIVDLERQVLTRMNRPSGEDAFLPLVASLGEVLDEHETTRLARIRFDDDGELAAELSFESFTDLEAVQAALEDRGIDTREGDNVRGEGGAYITQLFLRAS
ncbi:MAG: type II secretion system protein GspL [Pseudomonadota bacterium]